MTVERALVDQKCNRCHNLDRVFAMDLSPDEWRRIVARMADYAVGSAGALRQGDAEQIVHYLSAIRTREALGQRRADKTAPTSDSTPSRSGPGRPTGHLHLSMVVGLAFFGYLTFLAVRRPSPGPDSIRSSANSGPSLAPHVTSTNWVLKLVSIIPQTHDTKTLRFALPTGQSISFKPGQFLSLTFLFDGRKETRCYSICNSSATSGYIEITPKRMKNGSVSSYLNDRAKSGLTIEAAGAFGQFFFDQQLHKRIVLVAAGSGITPMISMLRTIADLGLETTATLLYCVRTSRDIIFASELKRIAEEIPTFRYDILCSEPEPGLPDSRGRINSNWVAAKVDKVAESDFFLCGPAPFMEVARTILIDLGADPIRIHQEHFSGPPSLSNSAEKQATVPGTVEFVRSAKKATIRSGQSLLQLAEESGVTIPFSCRQGQCGTCKVRLIAGSVAMDEEGGLDALSREHGFVLTCVGRAEGEVRIDA